MRDSCPYCRDPEDRRRKVKLHFETVCGMRVYRGVEGRKVYEARCPACRYTFTIDGGIDR
jgi:hypothetical protein